MSGLSRSSASARYSGDGQAAREPVRVVRRRTDERDHVPGVRIDGNYGGAFADQRLLGRFLHAQVDAQDQVVSRNRFLANELWRRKTDPVDAAALCVHEQLLVAGVAVQLIFVLAFDTQLADQRRA